MKKILLAAAALAVGAFFAQVWVIGSQNERLFGEVAQSFAATLAELDANSNLGGAGADFNRKNPATNSNAASANSNSADKNSNSASANSNLSGASPATTTQNPAATSRTANPATTTPAAPVTSTFNRGFFTSTAKLEFAINGAPLELRATFYNNFFAANTAQVWLVATDPAALQSALGAAVIRDIFAATRAVRAPQSFKFEFDPTLATLNVSAKSDGTSEVRAVFGDIALTDTQSGESLRLAALALNATLDSRLRVLGDSWAVGSLGLVAADGTSLRVAGLRVASDYAEPLDLGAATNFGFGKSRLSASEVRAFDAFDDVRLANVTLSANSALVGGLISLDARLGAQSVAVRGEFPLGVDDVRLDFAVKNLSLAAMDALASGEAYNPTFTDLLLPRPSLQVRYFNFAHKGRQFASSLGFTAFSQPRAMFGFEFGLDATSEFALGEVTPLLAWFEPFFVEDGGRLRANVKISADEQGERYELNGRQMSGREFNGALFGF